MTAVAARRAPRGRHHGLASTLYLIRLARAEQMATSYAVDPEFDDDPNHEPLTSEGLDYLHSSRR